jgi:hypothetical protein
MTFIGESLELRIPRGFERYGAMTIGEDVTTIGTMDMIIDGKYQCYLNILAQITIVPSEITNMTYKGVDYICLHLKSGDTFMTSYRVIQNSNIVYAIWTEWITGGKVPYALDYEGLLKLFEHVRELTGSGIGVSRSVYEGIISHICRDKDDVMKPYRLTDMKKPMQLIALKSISTATTGTVAKINGAFLDQGLTAALLYEVDQQQPFENILRGIPASEMQHPDNATM